MNNSMETVKMANPSIQTSSIPFATNGNVAFLPIRKKESPRKKAIEIKAASTTKDFKEIGQLRYRVYINELNYPQSEVDHSAETIHESVDLVSETYTAFEGERCVGTLRMMPTWAPIPSKNIFPIKEYEAIAPGGVKIGSKLIVDKEHRGSLLGVNIMKEAFEKGLLNGTRFCLLECYDHLVPFYERFGFQIHGKKIKDKVYGNVNVMVLDYHNLEHLRKVRSPFAKIVSKYFSDKNVLNSVAVNK